MARTLWMPAALALGAVLTAGGFASAQDTLRTGGPGANSSGFGGGTTMTLGGKGTAAEAAAADDTELTRCCRRWGGGCGWGGGYSVGWSGGWGGCGWGGGYTSFSFSSRPFCYQPVFRPTCGWGGGWNCGWNGGWGGGWNGGWGGGFCRISGSAADAGAPVVALTFGGTRPSEPMAQAPVNRPTANPVPKAEPAKPAPALPPTYDIPVSLAGKATTPAAKPYTFKAYGEK